MLGVRTRGERHAGVVATVIIILVVVVVVAVVVVIVVVVVEVVAGGLMRFWPGIRRPHGSYVLGQHGVGSDGASERTCNRRISRQTLFASVIRSTFFILLGGKDGG